MKKEKWMISVLFLFALLAGCGIGDESSTNQEQYSVELGVIASSEINKKSYFVPVLEGENEFSQKEKTSWNTQGISYGTFPIKDGENYWLVATGNAMHTNSEMLKVSGAGKVLQKVNYGIGAINSMSLDEKYLYATSAHDISTIKKFDKNGKEVLSKDYQVGMIHYLLASKGKLYCTATTLEKDEPVLLIVDAKTLEEEEKISLKEYGNGFSSCIEKDGILYLAPNRASNDEDYSDQLVKYKIENSELSTMKLKEKAPYQLSIAHDTMVVPSGYYSGDVGIHKVTLVDLSSGKQSVISTDGENVQAEIKEEYLYVLTQKSVTQYDLKNLKDTKKWTLPDVEKMNQVYIPNMIINK